MKGGERRAGLLLPVDVSMGGSTCVQSASPRGVLELGIGSPDASLTVTSAMKDSLLTQRTLAVSVIDK